MSLDERQLVESHKAGDSDAFVEIVHAYYPELLSHASRRLREQKSAEDAVQEALLRAFRALPRFNGEYRLGAWLHRILENVCADEGNRRRRESEVFERVSALPLGVEPEPQDEAAARMLDPGFVKALASLSPTYREALLLRYVDGLPYREVAAATGVSEENARARVHRARRVLRQVLGGAAGLLGWLVAGARRGERAITNPLEAAVVRLPAGTPLFVSAAAAVPGKTVALSRVATLVAAVALPVAGVGLGSTVDWLRGGEDAGSSTASSPISAGPQPAALEEHGITAVDGGVAGVGNGVSSASRQLRARVRGVQVARLRRVDGDTHRWGWFTPDGDNAGAREAGAPEQDPTWKMEAGLVPVAVSATSTTLRGKGTLRTDDGLVHGVFETAVDLPDERRAARPVGVTIRFTEDGGRSQPLHVVFSGTAVRWDEGKGQRLGLEGTYRVTGRELGLARQGRFSGSMRPGATDRDAVRLELTPPA